MSEFPWEDGTYRYKSTSLWVFKIHGNDMDMFHTGFIKGEVTDTNKGTITFGEFGDTPPEIEKLTGKKKFNVQCTLFGGQMTSSMLWREETKDFVLVSFASSELDYMVKLNDEELKELIESGEPFDNMSSPYKVQPENQGKLVWISGPPGAGKSTSAQLMSRKHGWVYFEADCVMNMANPYLPNDIDNVSMSQMFQNHLKGYSDDDHEMAGYGERYYNALMAETGVDDSEGCKFYEFMSTMVKNEKKRLGGNFAVAQAVPSRIMRDAIRKVLGKELVFVLLKLTPEFQKERIMNRHQDGDESVNQAIIEMCTKINKFYESAEVDEENTFDIVINGDLTPDDVVEKILKIVA